MRKLVILAASLSLALAGCNLTTGQQLVVAAAYRAAHACSPTSRQEPPWTATEMNLPAGPIQPRAERSSAGRPGNAVLDAMHAACSGAPTAGQQVMAAEAASKSTK